jgi:hypothetical protein
VYYKCVKFHKNPISRLGGVALTRYMDGHLFAGGIIMDETTWYRYCQW